MSNRSSIHAAAGRAHRHRGHADGTVQKFAGGYSLDAILRAIGGPEA